MKKNKRPQFSIITVCFNEEQRIRETCESVVGQTFSDYEWIIIDGNSSDNTLNIIKEYEKNIKTLISEKDEGVYDAMNKGINIARGKYLLFLNGGDSLYSNDVLEELFSLELNGDILYGNCCVIRKDGNKQILDYTPKINKYFFLDSCINHQSALIKKDLFDKFGGYSNKYKILADFEKWLFFLKNKAEYQKVPLVIANFNFFDGLSSKEEASEKKMTERSEIIDTYFNCIEKLTFKISKKLKH